MNPNTQAIADSIRRVLLHRDGQTLAAMIEEGIAGEGLDSHVAAAFESPEHVKKTAESIHDELTDTELLRWARVAAYGASIQPDSPTYLPQTAKEAGSWRPHVWVLEAMRIAVNFQHFRDANSGTKAVEAERERCCRIVFGQCSSDNVAQRTVDAINKGAAS